MPISLTKLLNKYSAPGGRYTYYPTHAGWQNNLNYFQWFDIVKETYNPETGLDLYLHIPFCESLCTFCGCNIRVTKSYQDVLPYINSLKNEWKFYQKILGENIKINSLYLGGGSPNFLKAEDLDNLISFFSNNDSQISVELDPRFTTEDQLNVLKKHNTHTLSFGVQDFDAHVLENVNRDQNIDELMSVIKRARELNFPAINIDLIYGLTHQTPETLIDTFKTLKSFDVDSVALYPFAMVPWQNNTQKAFGNFKVFNREEMNELYSIGNKALIEMGYTHIGMGHYLNARSPLLSVFKNKKLKRNIMGYTERKTPLLIGLGVSSFSSAPKGHIQNEKVLEPYMQAIAKERLPVLKAHSVSPAELELANIFEKIICEDHFTEEDRQKILPGKEEHFRIFLENNFIEKDGNEYLITEAGRYFLKGICQCWG